MLRAVIRVVTEEYRGSTGLKPSSEICKSGVDDPFFLVVMFEFFLEKPRKDYSHSQMLSPGRISHSSNHTRSPSFFSRSATSRTTSLSLALWLRKTSYGNSSGIVVLAGL